MRAQRPVPTGVVLSMLIPDSPANCFAPRVMSTPDLTDTILPRIWAEKRCQGGAETSLNRIIGGLVSRFRSSHHCAAPSSANFGIKGTLATL